MCMCVLYLCRVCAARVTKGNLRQQRRQVSMIGIHLSWPVLLLVLLVQPKSGCKLISQLPGPIIILYP